LITGHLLGNTEEVMLHAFKALGAILLLGTASVAEAQTIGMERRQDRRMDRQERREIRRDSAPIVSQQPLTVTVTPSAGRTFTDVEGTWERVAARDLWATGPRYDEPSGVRIGRGSVIPDWIDAAPMRNVSIRGLDHYQSYDYFVSPDDRVVILSPSSRRVARIMRPRG
jgi:hypothetical protein